MVIDEVIDSTMLPSTSMDTFYAIASSLIGCIIFCFTAVKLWDKKLLMSINIFDSNLLFSKQVKYSHVVCIVKYMSLNIVLNFCGYWTVKKYY